MDAITYLRGLADALEKWKDQINDALQYAEGTHTFDDVAAMIMNGRLVFIPMEDAFYVVEVVEYPRKKVLNIFLAGGELRTVLTSVKEIEHVAKNAGCSAVTLSGRRGWEKYAKECGWRYSHTTLVCDVGAQNG